MLYDDLSVMLYDDLTQLLARRPLNQEVGFDSGMERTLLLFC